MKRPVQTALSPETSYVKGVADERLRITSILNLSEAANRTAQAQAIALTTNMSPEQAAAVLAVSPTEASPFLQAMDAGGYIGLIAPNSSGAGGITDARAARLAEIKENIQLYNDIKAGRAPKVGA